MARVHHHTDDEPPYGFTERELAFKLLASHALVDGPFYEALRNDPEAAAAQLHVRLSDEDIEYIKSVVEWGVLDANASDIRAALHLDMVTNSW